MELLGDRFVMLSVNGALDLATGEHVLVTELEPAAPRDEAAWAEQCAVATRVRDAGGSRLIDFGATVNGRRFEAWTHGPRTPSDAAERWAGDAFDRAAAAIGHAIDHSSGPRPRVVALQGRDRAAARAVALEAARHARGAGFVPLRTSLVSPRSVHREGARILEGLAGRSLFLIHDDAASSPGVALVSAVIRSPRPHLIVCVREAEVPGVETVILPDAAPVRRAGRPARAAEQAPAYRTESADAEDSLPLPGVKAATAPDLLVWRRRVVDARAQLDARRHAGGERLLRQAIGALTRRHDWAGAGEALNTLARVLLKRGRPREALEELARAAEALTRVHDELRLLDTALLTSRARLQLLDLDAAEATSSAALTASRMARDGCRSVRAAAALATILLWRGRYDDARDIVERCDAGEIRSHPSVRSVRAVADIGRGRVKEALGAATALAESATSAGPGAAARAAALMAFAHLSVGDVAPVARELETARHAARDDGDRLLLVQCQLLAAEAARRRGEIGVAATLAARLTRIRDTAVPPLIRAHVRLVGDLLRGGEPPHAIAARHAKATGLLGLQLLVPAETGRDDWGAGGVERVIEILEACQSAEDEPKVLSEVCARTRTKLHAAGVAVYAATEGRVWLVASDGGRVDAPIADRAVVAGIGIEPHQHEDRLEAAVPVRYAGTIAGAVAARWPLGSPYPRAHAPGTLAITASAVAPLLAVVRARSAVLPPSDLIGVSGGARDVRAAIERAAAAPFPVLVEGESGSGKELVARALHRGGPRRDRPFCTLNCAALPDDLIESELFGHARGAFTGALADRAGVFEEAHTGTLLLDEVGELSPRAQAKLLRVIQEGEIRRVGENLPRRVDVRIVAATNRDLRREAEAGRFRTDLLYRLDVIRIVVPPLRERREDIALLAQHHWNEATKRVGSRAVLSAATIAALARYEWPGNVRELQNVLSSLAVRVGKRGAVGPAALPALFGAGPAATSSRLDEARRTFEERFVRAALVRTGGRRNEAAAELGVTRQGLAKLIARLGIND